MHTGMRKHSIQQLRTHIHTATFSAVSRAPPRTLPQKKPLFTPECTSVLQFVDQVPQRTEWKRDINYSISNTSPTSRYQPVRECVHVQPHSGCSKWRPSRMSRMRCPFRLAPPSDSSTTCMPFQTSHLPPITITTLSASTLGPCHPLLLPRFGNSVFSSVDCKSQL